MSCGLVSAPETVELPASTLIFSFGSGVTFGSGRGTAGGCSVTPCQGVFLIRRVSSGLLSVPWNSELPARTLTFSFGSGVTFGPGRGTAGGGCFPDSKGVFWLAFCALEQWNCLPEPCFFHSAQE